MNAGADCLFVEAPTSKDELQHVTDEFSDEVPLLANMTEGGKTPLFTAETFQKLGFDVVLYPATGFKAAAKTLQNVYNEIATTGTQDGVMDSLLTWEERNEITGLEAIERLEERYSN